VRHAPGVRRLPRRRSVHAWAMDSVGGVSLLETPGGRRNGEDPETEGHGGDRGQACPLIVE